MISNSKHDFSNTSSLFISHILPYPHPTSPASRFLFVKRQPKQTDSTSHRPTRHSRQQSSRPKRTEVPRWRASTPTTTAKRRSAALGCGPPNTDLPKTNLPKTDLEKGKGPPVLLPSRRLLLRPLSTDIESPHRRRRLPTPENPPLPPDPKPLSTMILSNPRQNKSWFAKATATLAPATLAPAAAAAAVAAVVRATPHPCPSPLVLPLMLPRHDRQEQRRRRQWHLPRATEQQERFRPP